VTFTVNFLNLLMERLVFEDMSLRNCDMTKVFAPLFSMTRMCVCEREWDVKQTKYTHLDFNLDFMQFT